MPKRIKYGTFRGCFNNARTFNQDTGAHMTAPTARERTPKEIADAAKALDYRPVLRACFDLGIISSRLDLQEDIAVVSAFNRLAKQEAAAGVQFAFKKGKLSPEQVAGFGKGGRKIYTEQAVEDPVEARQLGFWAPTTAAQDTDWIADCADDRWGVEEDELEEVAVTPAEVTLSRKEFEKLLTCEQAKSYAAAMTRKPKLSAAARRRAMINAKPIPLPHEIEAKAASKQYDLTAQLKIEVDNNQSEMKMPVRKNKKLAAMPHAAIEIEVIDITPPGQLAGVAEPAPATYVVSAETSVAPLSPQPAQLTTGVETNQNQTNMQSTNIAAPTPEPEIETQATPAEPEVEEEVDQDLLDDILRADAEAEAETAAECAQLANDILDTDPAEPQQPAPVQAIQASGSDAPAGGDEDAQDLGIAQDGGGTDDTSLPTVGDDGIKEDDAAEIGALFLDIEARIDSIGGVATRAVDALAVKVLESAAKIDELTIAAANLAKQNEVLLETTARMAAEQAASSASVAALLQTVAALTARLEAAEKKSDEWHETMVSAAQGQLIFERRADEAHKALAVDVEKQIKTVNTRVDKLVTSVADLKQAPAALPAPAPLAPAGLAAQPDSVAESAAPEPAPPTAPAPVVVQRLAPHARPVKIVIRADGTSKTLDTPKQYGAMVKALTNAGTTRVQYEFDYLEDSATLVMRMPKRLIKIRLPGGIKEYSIDPAFSFADELGFASKTLSSGVVRRVGDVWEPHPYDRAESEKFIRATFTADLIKYSPTRDLPPLSDLFTMYNQAKKVTDYRKVSATTKEDTKRIGAAAVVTLGLAMQTRKASERFQNDHPSEYRALKGEAFSQTIALMTEIVGNPKPAWLTDTLDAEALLGETRTAPVPRGVGSQPANYAAPPRQGPRGRGRGRGARTIDSVAGGAWAAGPPDPVGGTASLDDQKTAY